MGEVKLQKCWERGRDGEGVEGEGKGSEEEGDMFGRIQRQPIFSFI